MRFVVAATLSLAWFLFYAVGCAIAFGPRHHGGGLIGQLIFLAVLVWIWRRVFRKVDAIADVGQVSSPAEVIPPVAPVAENEGKNRVSQDAIRVAALRREMDSRCK